MDDVATLRAEIDTLKVRLRTAAIVAGVGGLALVGLLLGLMGRPAGESVVTREIVVVGEDGTVRARLGTSALGDAQLTLSDGQGHERMWLKAGDRHATFEITDAERHTLVRLSSVGNLSGLHLAHSGGAQTAQMTASTETASVTLVDLDRSLMAQLRADPAGTDLELSRNPVGESPRLATLSAGSADPQKGSSLVLAGPNQFLQASVHPADGEPRITLAGDTRLESRTTPGEAPWQSFDRPDAPP